MRGRGAWQPRRRAPSEAGARSPRGPCPARRGAPPTPEQLPGGGPPLAGARLARPPPRAAVEPSCAQTLQSLAAPLLGRRRLRQQLAGAAAEEAGEEGAGCGPAAAAAAAASKSPDSCRPGSHALLSVMSAEQEKDPIALKRSRGTGSAGPGGGGLAAAGA